MSAPEPLDYHFARPGERFLSMVGENRQHPVQERVLSGAQMVEDVRESLCRRPLLRACRPAAGAVERYAVVRNGHDPESTPAATITQLNCYDFSNYIG
jgi:hypothetical protein